jgi:hypothetical protein
MTMATKYYCDGCDKELPPAMIENISVSVKKNGDVSAAGGAYELCKGCAANLVRESNPRNWTRAAEEMREHGF